MTHLSEIHADRSPAGLLSQLLQRLVVWGKRRRRAYALKHQNPARIRQLERVLNALNDQGLLEDVTGLHHTEIKAVLRLPADQARREIARLMQDVATDKRTNKSPGKG